MNLEQKDEEIDWLLVVKAGTFIGVPLGLLLAPFILLWEGQFFGALIATVLLVLCFAVLCFLVKE